MRAKSLTLLVLLALSACEKNEPKPESTRKESDTSPSKVEAIDPNLAEAHEYMGEALIAVGRIEDAKKHLAILEKLDPKLAEELREEITRHQRS